MVSKFTFFSSLLLVSVALAVPSSLLEASFARGREDRHPRSTNLVALRADAASDETHSDRWAGAILTMRKVRIIPMVYDHVSSYFFCPTGTAAFHLCQWYHHPPKP